MTAADGALVRQILEAYCGFDVFSRGSKYAKEGRALVTSHSGGGEYIRVEGVVYGSREYEVLLLVNLKAKQITNFECSCPYADSGDICKHIVALGLVFLENQKNAFDPARQIAPPPNFFSPSLWEPTPPQPQPQSLPPVQPQSIQSGQVLAPEDVRDLLAKLGIDSNLLSENALQELSVAAFAKSSFAAIPVPIPIKAVSQPPKKAAPQKTFTEKYNLVLRPRHGGVLDRPYFVRSDARRYMSWHQEVSLAPKSLLRQETHLSDDERALLELMSTLGESTQEEYTSDDPYDIAAVVVAAHRAHVCLVQSELVRGAFVQYEWQESERFEVVLKLLQKTFDDTMFREKYICSVIELELPQFLNMKGVFSHGSDGGLVVVYKKTVRVLPLTFATARIVARALQQGQMDMYGYGFDRFGKKAELRSCTELSEDEYVHLNSISHDLETHCALTSTLPKRYGVVKHEAKPVIVVDYDSSQSTLAVLPSVDYGAVVLPVSDILYRSSNKRKDLMRRNGTAFGGISTVVRVQEGEVHYAHTDHGLEVKMFNLGEKTGEKLGLTRRSRAVYKGDKQIEKWTLDFLPELQKLPFEIRYVHDVPDIQRTEFRANFDIQGSLQQDWLAFDLELYCGEERVQLSDIEAYLKEGGSLLKTKDGRLFKITNPETITRLLELLAHFKKGKGGTYEGKAFHAPALSAMAQSSKHYTTQISKSFSKFFTETSSGKAVKPVRIPAPFSKTLRAYQSEGVHWMHYLRQYRFAGILADDMGLGKTIQTIAMLSMHAQKGRTSLVVAPKTLLSNWEAEVKTFAPHLKVVVIEGSESERLQKIASLKSFDLAVTSYPAVQRDILQYEKIKKPFLYCVLDEAQYIKNPRTKNAHAVKKVPSDYRLALTGTPMENKVEELWSIFDFLMPGFLGHHAHFQKYFSNPIMRRSDQEALQNLKSRVSGFMLRRTKDEVLLELPPKVEQILECTLSDDQNILYQAVLAQVRDDLQATVTKKGFAQSHIHILAGLTKLRQICNHPALVMPQRKGKEYPSVKLDTCLELVRSFSDQKRKVLIFSQFTSMLDILADAFKKEKIGYSYLSGKTQKRGAVVDEFTHDKAKTVFLISTKAGGTGLNLTAADAVIIFDPWWNPQVERQAVDRAHRIGQTKSINVYRLRTKGTIEEKIGLLQERKAQLFGALVGESRDLFQKLTWQDVKQLLV